MYEVSISLKLSFTTIKEPVVPGVVTCLGIVNVLELNTVVAKVPLIDGAYDKGGAYWGFPDNLRVAYTKDLSYVEFYRTY